MTRVRVPPGRAGRLWLERRLHTAGRAVDLLDRRLRILRSEQGRLRLLAERTSGRWLAASGTADYWLVRAAVLTGQRGLRLATPAVPAEVSVQWEAVMGVRYPVAAQVTPPPRAEAAVGSAALAEATAAYGAALRAAVDHAVAAAATAIVDAEVSATRRRMHAISDRWMPRLDEALREVTQRLEEDERAETVRLRWAAARPDVESAR